MAVYDINGNAISGVASETAYVPGIVSVQSDLNGYLYGSGDHHFVSGSGNEKTAVYSVVPGETYIIKSESMRPRFNVGCFASIPENNLPALYYEAHSGENEFSLTVPNTASIKYMALYYYNVSADSDDPDDILAQITVAGTTLTTLPNSVTYIDDSLNGYIDDQESPKTTFKMCTWNIGHFSMGVDKNTAITDSDYVAKLNAYCKMIQSCSADIFAVQEYSAIFADTTAEDVLAKDTLFGNYKTQFIGEQRNYSCNAVFSNLNVRNMAAHDYECNQDAVITHTSLILATDYYYVKWRMVLNGRDILCISTHLAFDNNNPDVLQQNQISELLDVCDGEPYVLIFGDFNTTNLSAFTNAGFDIVNNSGIPFLTGIDNIVAKGVSITVKKWIVDSATLSDHAGILAEITVS